jgi:hypothetical protein
MNAKQTPVRDHELATIGSQFRFDALDTPGCYVSNWSGHLIRVPEDALKQGNSPMIEVRGREPMIVTKLSNDPYLTISKARMIAADLDVSVEF